MGGDAIGHIDRGGGASVSSCKVCVCVCVEMRVGVVVGLMDRRVDPPSTRLNPAANEADGPMRTSGPETRPIHVSFLWRAFSPKAACRGAAATEPSSRPSLSLFHLLLFLLLFPSSFFSLPQPCKAMRVTPGRGFIIMAAISLSLTTIPSWGRRALRMS